MEKQQIYEIILCKEMLSTGTETCPRRSTAMRPLVRKHLKALMTNQELQWPESEDGWLEKLIDTHGWS